MTSGEVVRWKEDFIARLKGEKAKCKSGTRDVCTYKV